MFVCVRAVGVIHLPITADAESVMVLYIHVVCLRGCSMYTYFTNVMSRSSQLYLWSNHVYMYNVD